MITAQQLLALLEDMESARVERTTSLTNMDKFCEAVCAFANDMSGSGLPGHLLIGADDEGRPSGLQVTDELLTRLGGIASDGNILPAPSLQVERVTLPAGGGEIAVVSVQPSPLPPVRYKGRVWIRRGPRKAIANEADESILIERRAAGLRSFDSRPCPEAKLSDLALELFTSVYRPNAIDAETIAENHRPIEQQLASLRFFDLAGNCPTYAGLILFSKDLGAWLPNAYVQYVRFAGTGLADDVVAEKEFRGDLLTLIRDLASFAGLIGGSRRRQENLLIERMEPDYPDKALKELLMNAVLHRSYEMPQPIRFYHYDDRIEIQNPGPLYGLANAGNFPTQTSYRNPVLAEAMKTLGAVDRFGRGVARAQAALARNGNPPAEFHFGENHFGVILRVGP